MNIETTYERLPKALIKVQAMSAKLKTKLEKAKMKENLGQDEIRQLSDAIGSDVFARIAGRQVFAEVMHDFNQFVDNLVC